MKRIMSVGLGGVTKTKQDTESTIRPLRIILDDQSQVDLKPAGQPEQASLNQCQLMAQIGALRMPS